MRFIVRVQSHDQHIGRKNEMPSIDDTSGEDEGQGEEQQAPPWKNLSPADVDKLLDNVIYKPGHRSGKQKPDDQS